MRRRVPQPPIDLSCRPTERHDFWAAFVCTLIGLLLVLGGALRMTAVETTSGGTAWEMQLIRAFANGGLHYAEIAAPGDLPESADATDPTGGRAAFPRTETKRGETGAGRQVRVDLGAATPCPT